jgi:hypothetical protein
MAIKPSGQPIKASDIRNEFGPFPTVRLGAYRVSQTVGELTRPLDDGIPTSGPIGFGSFYSKSLNVVVYCSGNRVNARSLYNNNNNVTVIGGFKTRPTSSSGTKVWIHTDAAIGERNSTDSRSATTINYCSLITGTWNNNTDLRLDIGPSGVVSGGGGNGGNGGGATWLVDALTDATPGLFGTSAIGVNHQPITITNRGTIQGGTGGGGGGGSAWARDKNQRGKSRFAVAGGGGGGGGKGIPGGAKGAGGDATFDNSWDAVLKDGSSGTSGSQTVGGNGGAGGSADNSFAKCDGGDGGNHQLGGDNGVILLDPNSSGYKSGAGPGASGYGIIITNNGTGVSISGNARSGGDAYSTTVS